MTVRTRLLIACAVALVLPLGACASAARSGEPATTPTAGLRLDAATRSAPAPTPGGARLAGEHTCAAPFPSGPPTTATVFCADPSRMEAATVVRIVDGDTIHVELDGKEEIIRFYGIDTTEVGQPCSSEATQRTRELVGHEVRLVPDARNRDKYGRLLRYVYTPQGLSIDAEMVDEGLAHAWRSDGALRLAIIALEDAAQGRRDGCLWR